MKRSVHVSWNLELETDSVDDAMREVHALFKDGISKDVPIFTATEMAEHGEYAHFDLGGVASVCIRRVQNAGYSPESLAPCNTNLLEAAKKKRED